MNRFVAIIFPIYNWGQAALVLLVAVILGAIALSGDPLLARDMGIAAYLGIVASMFLLGLAPAEMEITARQIAPLEARLDAARLLTRIGDRLWAPTRYRSWWWESDRISIVERPGGTYALKARLRDLKILRAFLSDRPGSDESAAAG
jgi:hypothetical protein